MKEVFILIFLLIGSICVLRAQDPEETEEEPFSLTVDYTTPLTIDLEEEEEEVVAPKKKKRKKKVFYGMKTKKGFNRITRGKNVYIEFFYYLKEPAEIDSYVRDIYWFDFKKRKIIKTRKPNLKYCVMLHGPYRRINLDDEVLEEGIFYKGMKHGRWVSNEKFYEYYVLKDKAKFIKGWPKESRVAYYDLERTQLKEVIPIEYGEKEGYYFKFHENGQIAAWGEYKFDHKVGIWNEYYNDKRRRRRKRQVQYPDDPFDENFKPYISKEWDEKGRLLYDHNKFMSRN
jgi:antitoxin component YwqK of YwqJK toxin-antitoxin module